MRFALGGSEVIFGARAKAQQSTRAYGANFYAEATGTRSNATLLQGDALVRVGLPLWCLLGNGGRVNFSNPPEGEFTMTYASEMVGN